MTRDMSAEMPKSPAELSAPRTEEDRDRLTREALAEVDAGNTVDDAVIAAWIRALGPA